MQDVSDFTTEKKRRWGGVDDGKRAVLGTAIRAVLGLIPGPFGKLMWVPQAISGGGEFWGSKGFPEGMV